MEVVWDFEGVSPQLRYLLDNNQLLNPTASENNASKEDKLKEQSMPDLGAAYLGPQIWNKTMANDDLKLEPVDWDELLNENTINEMTIDQQVADLALLMCPSVSEDYVTQEQQQGAACGVSAGIEPHESGGLIAMASDHRRPAPPHVKPPAGRARDSSALPDPPRQVENFEPSEAFGVAKEKPVGEAMPLPPGHDYHPSVCDALISTSVIRDDSQMSTSEGSMNVVAEESESGGPKELFDPRKRTFTDDELKPQPIIRKAKKVYVPEDCKDSRYWRKREKNNVAAKRSREARRVKENQIAMRANFLEKENENLRSEVSELRDELARLMDVVKGYQEKR